MRKTTTRRLVSAATCTLLAVLGLTAPTASAQFTCFPLSSPAPSTTIGSLTGADPLQTGRIVLDGRPSSCTGKTGSLQNTVPVHAKAYTFANPTFPPALTVCITVDFDHTGCGSNATSVVAYSTYDPANPAANVIGDSGTSGTGIGSFSFDPPPGPTYTLVVHETVPNSGCASFTFTNTVWGGCRQLGWDNGDELADLTVFRPSNTFWYKGGSAEGNQTMQGQAFGEATDILVPADYFHEGTTDIMVYRPSSGTWRHPGDIPPITFWGLSTDIPVPVDYDRDSVPDIAVWRPSNGTWYILKSTTQSIQAFPWGQAGDIPVTADFDGDLRWDYAVVRPNDPATGGRPTWYIRQSNFQYGVTVIATYGQSGDMLVPGDYDGDGRADIAVFRSSDGFWKILQSSVTVGNPQRVVQFGQNGDIPQPGDYDGDGKMDVAVFRPSNGNWYWLRSSTGEARGKHFGQAGDVPVTTYYPIRTLP